MTVAADALPATDQDEFFHVDLVGCTVLCGERSLGAVRRVHEYPANDVLELDSGEMIPFVDRRGGAVDVAGRSLEVGRGLRVMLEIDVFTLFPEALRLAVARRGRCETRPRPGRCGCACSTCATTRWAATARSTTRPTAAAPAC